MVSDGRGEAGELRNKYDAGWIVLRTIDQPIPDLGDSVRFDSPKAGRTLLVRNQAGSLVIGSDHDPCASARSLQSHRDKIPGVGIMATRHLLILPIESAAIQIAL